MAAGSFSSAIAPLVDFVYPPRCPLCGDGIASVPGLCAGCWDKLEFPGEPACVHCQVPLPGEGAGGVCDRCSARPPRHAGVHAAVIYGDNARQLVLRFKHGGRIGLARLMGRLVAGRLADLPGDAVLVPVPLHRTRLWLRGYNQAALIAREIARHTGHGVVVDGLRRSRATPKLGGLGRIERARTMRGAIEATAARKPLLAGRNVVLVDDVFTSGATSNACVSALLDAGAKSVKIACFARVPEGARVGLGPKCETPGTVKIPGAA